MLKIGPQKVYGQGDRIGQMVGAQFLHAGVPGLISNTTWAPKHLLELPVGTNVWVACQPTHQII